tara:strand:+ start:254 stop:604 length:351 start_codon:yes stop_codon:yes gene_type:complete
MERFNKYNFISELKESIGEFIEDSEFENDEDITDEMQEFIHNYINDATIYYVDCWAISYELGCSDFTIEQTGTKAKNINELAYWSLWDLVEDSINYHLETKELQEKLKEPETFKHF